jgi:Na+-translocating ferredoxin:NAD+ oxidoreductase RNF subunit RnfB
MDAYKRLAEHLDALPNGFPSTEDGRELLILRKLFTTEQAELAAQLTTEFETAAEIAKRTGGDAASLRGQLKAMSRGGLIEAGRKGAALAFKSMPFIVGIYEMQLHTLDAELSRLMEAYFMGGFGQMLSLEPHFHRVIPAHEAQHEALEIRPFESAAEIVRGMGSWAVQDCICRKQKALIGQACKHPVEVCMVMDSQPTAFDGSPYFRALSQEEAMGTLRGASEAGLVHTVSNTMEGTFYICNCCTCSCGILRGMADLGIANVVASSPFVNEVRDELCTGCEACIAACQFSALSMDGALAKVERGRCVGCGVCVLNCEADALVLRRRAEVEIKPVPRTRAEWDAQRLARRGF